MRMFDDTYHDDGFRVGMWYTRLFFSSHKRWPSMSAWTLERVLSMNLLSVIYVMWRFPEPVPFAHFPHIEKKDIGQRRNFILHHYLSISGENRSSRSGYCSPQFIPVMKFVSPASLDELLSLLSTDPAMVIPVFSRLCSPRTTRMPVEILLDQEVEEGVDHNAGAMIIRRFSRCVRATLLSIP